MIDFIFGVTHPEHWHSLNIRQNPHHYSCLRYLGSKVIRNVQDNMGAGIYYNPYAYVDVNNSAMRSSSKTINTTTTTTTTANSTLSSSSSSKYLIKYGVVAIDTLQKDLTEWQSFYIAGRLQKPVAILRADARVQLANKLNRMNAVRVALLMLPREFTEEELFLTIAGLSYSGDFRMKVGGENPFKIYNIVHTQMDYFRFIYKPIIDELPDIQYLDVDNGILVQQQENSVQNLKMRTAMLSQLPLSFRSRIAAKHLFSSSTGSGNMRNVGSGIATGGGGGGGGGEDDDSGSSFSINNAKLTAQVVQSPLIEKHARQALVEIVYYPALFQAIKGVFTAGVFRSLKYVGEKMSKGRKKKN